MNIVVLSGSASSQYKRMEHVNWVDTVNINKKGHLLGTVNNKRVIESTRVVEITLESRGIRLKTRSGNGYIVSTPGAKAMKTLFKKLVAQSC